MLERQTSFADAIAIPQLANACCEVPEVDQEMPGTGLKVLREVSKKISIAMLAHIQSCTLFLEEAELQHYLKAVALLQHTRLSHFCIQGISKCKFMKGIVIDLGDNLTSCCDMV